MRDSSKVGTIQKPEDAVFFGLFCSWALKNVSSFELNIGLEVTSAGYTHRSRSMSHILVVEDDADIAALIAHYLEKAGHRVERVASGSDVLPHLRKSPPELVILDLMLPGMDGLLVCQAMRADPALGAIPIIMVTARGEE